MWQRAMIILGLLCIPICGVLLATEKLLLLGGQMPTVAAMTAAYVRSASASASQYICTVAMRVSTVNKHSTLPWLVEDARSCALESCRLFSVLSFWAV